MYELKRKTLGHVLCAPSRGTNEFHGEFRSRATAYCAEYHTPIGRGAQVVDT